MSKEVKRKLIDAYRGMDEKGRAAATRDLMKVLSGRKAISSNTK